MAMRKDLLAYCGLYCGDCPGYIGEIADSATHMKKVLDKYKFDRPAKYLFQKELKEYDKFLDMLQFMTKLRCEKNCRQRKDDETPCEIMKCCRDKGFYACYECDDFEQCEKLKIWKDLHGDSCVKNLKAIKKMGVENWLKSGKRYWFDSVVYY